MSLNIRAHPHDASSNTRSSSRSRKVIIGFLIILTLFLIGTVIVLSSVSYYLGIPTSAYLTEDEVAWSPAHVIKPLLYEPEGSAIQHRRRNDTLPSASTIDEDWIQMEDQLEAEEDLEDPAVEPTAHTSSADSVSMLASDGEWDVDGRGSGNYWMKANWDGHVDGTHDWTRLFNVSTRQGETIPRLIHQTWKNDILPPKWRKAWKECREGMPDYEYMLWTDETAREFVKTFYPAHLHMYDSYKYPIQRADSIRYFVLHHFGGVYMDLDIGCRRRLDPLLQGDWDTILPITKPVGVSNDLIFSAKGSAFMDDVVHALPAWNHEWVSNYPTVMFSTGPMFVSGQYAIYSSAHPITDVHPRAEVRILPKSLYGKNAPMSTVPHSFFSHFYGSSWHADDAGFITFLGSWGKKLMYVGAVVIVLGILRLIYQRYTKSSPQYQLMSILPTASSSSTHSGSTTPPLGSSYSASSSPYSPTSGFDNQQLPSEIASAFKRAGNLILAAPATLLHGDRRNARRRNGLLYFVPAAFLPTTTGRGRTASEASQLPLRRPRRQGSGPLGSGVKTSGKEVPPPPYERESMDTPQFGERSASPIPMKTLGSAFHEEDIDIYSRDGESSSTSEFDVEGPEEDGDWAAWDEGKTTPRR